MTEIWYEPEVPLPDGYKGIEYGAEYDEVIKTAEYIGNEYKDFMGMKNPQISLFSDYGISDKAYRSYNLRFFEGAEDIIGQIINYNFNTVFFAVRDEGIWLIRFWNSNLSDKVGDYPIISADTAKALLANSQYLTTVPEDFPGAEYVKKVELVYQNTAQYSYFMPYYEFYVELPTMERADGLKTYGIYYVPAVEEQYITNMPKCIHFN